MKFISYNNEQGILLPGYVEDWLPEDHLARVINAVVNRLDLSKIEDNYGEEGRPAYHPRMLLKVIFYGYSTGTRGSRKIAKKLETDLAYIYLSGHQRPDFRTISDFRKDYLEALHDLFVQIVVICKQLGMVKLGHVSLDGVRIKGNASSKRTKEKKELEKEIKRLREEISKIFQEATEIDEKEDKAEVNKGKDIPDELSKKQELVKRLEESYKVLQELGLDKVNITDPEARFQKTEYGLKPGYNGECIVDDANQVIVAEQVTTECVDADMVKPMVEQLEWNVGNRPDKLSADSGFYSGKNIAYLESKEIDGYIPSNQTEDSNGGRFAKKNFRYSIEKDIYICPEDKMLEYRKSYVKKDKRHKPKKVMLYECKDCNGCRFQKQCISKSNKSGLRSIARDGYEEYRDRMEKKMREEESKKIFSMRGSIIEPVFGNWKENLGYRQFLLRGLIGTSGEFSLMCMTHNIKKIRKFWREMVLNRPLSSKFVHKFKFFVRFFREGISILLFGHKMAFLYNF